MSRRYLVAVVASLGAATIAIGGCVGTPFADVGGPGNGAPGQCTPGEDQDGDGIPDEIEGCGPPPRDTDGDGIPDYLDTDSDSDGIADGDEDLNGDGLLGCCLQSCGEQRRGCPVVEPDECGAGQHCAAGTCLPPAHFLCSNGETDPRSATTFPHLGKPDSELPSFVCHKAGEHDVKGLKPIVFHTSAAGDWKVALEIDSTYGELDIGVSQPQEAAAVFDLRGPQQAVAGFIVSRSAGGSSDINAVADSATAAISANLPQKVSVTQLSSGANKTSHDGFPTVVSTNLAIKVNAARRPAEVRDGVIEALLGRKPTKVPPADFGPSGPDYLLRMQVLLRPDGRVLVMGGVGAAPQVNDPTQATGFHLEDLSNGTGLATVHDSSTVECDPFLGAGNPVADIIWVVDESGSMDDNREDIVANAKDFFARALKSGLDFRMGVTGVKNPNSANVQVGKFCGHQMAPYSMFDNDDGGPDRFLLPTEQKIFESCVANPPYYEGGSEYGLAATYEGITRHLPRTAGDPGKIRPEATLVVIIATDEAPNELKSGGKYDGKSGFLSSSAYSGSNRPASCTLSSSDQQKVDQYLQPWIDLVSGNDPTWGLQAQAMVHLIGGLCSSTGCGNSPPELGHGYFELVHATGGLTADVCQQNLGATLQLIIDSVVGASSPAVLQYTPISASIAVAVDTEQLERSRVKGFDYIGAANSLVFIGVNLDETSAVMASYRRWVKQAVIN